MGNVITVVQVTVAPTGTVIVCGPKTKLSIFTAASAAEGWSFAVTLERSGEQQYIAIITGTATPAIHTFLLRHGSCFLSNLMFFLVFI